VALQAEATEAAAVRRAEAIPAVAEAEVVVVAAAATTR
jgi:hypothetical protein